MYLRLAFAVAAHLEPEVLLVDEVLAVGDVAFQKKCLGRMGEVAKEGRTVLFVSHNMSAVKELCQRALLINSGNVAFQGDSSECIGEYMRLVENKTLTSVNQSNSLSVGKLQIKGDIGPDIASGKPFRVTLSLFGREVRNPWMFFIIEDFTGQTVVHSRVKSGDIGTNVINGECKLELDLPVLWLSPGIYTIYFKFLIPSASGSSGKFFSERILLEVGGQFEQSGRAVLNPDIRWKVSTDVEESELVTFDLHPNFGG